MIRNLCVPDLIKIDVEGMEVDVVAGIPYIGLENCILSIEANRKADTERLIAELLKKHYHMFLVLFAHEPNSTESPVMQKSNTNFRKLVRSAHIVACQSDAVLKNMENTIRIKSIIEWEKEMDRAEQYYYVYHRWCIVRSE